jgi:hypothetical protein
MALKKTTRARKSTARKRSRSSRRTASWARRSMAIPSIPYDGTVIAAAAFLIVVFIVAAALAIGPRGTPQGPLASHDLRADEPLAAQADPKRVPDARSAAEAAAMTDAPAAPAPVITLTGCLERNDETFRLKDASGEDVPKARSWKSGFLKRKPAAIQIVDAANRAKLTDHVGQRVSVTGQLNDREMTIRSLQPIASSCSKA